MRIDTIAAIVTGGASGLGAAVVQMLGKAGAKVAVLDMDETAGEGVAAAVGGVFIRTDVTDEADVESALERAEAANGVARILVNCAGVAPAMKAVSRDGAPLDIAAFRRVIDINLIGTFLVLSRFAARAMTVDSGSEERAVIVNTASIAAFDGQIGHAAYAASKAAVAGMTLPLAREFARQQIRVSTIAPGLFETPILVGIAEAVAAAARHVQYPARMGMPAEFASLVREIIENAMFNGETVRLDGAVRLPPR